MPFILTYNFLYLLTVHNVLREKLLAIYFKSKKSSIWVNLSSFYSNGSGNDDFNQFFIFLFFIIMFHLMPEGLYWKKYGRNHLALQ